MGYYMCAMGKNQFITLKNDRLEVILYTLGASIYSIRFNNEDMIITPSNVKDFEKGNIYYGKTIGRVCGRIPAGKYQNYNFEGNEEGVSLHGGFNGLSAKTFEYETRDNQVIFKYLSKTGEAGYPGNLYLMVIYEINDNSLLIKYRVTVDEPCLVALTNHTFYALGEKDVRELKLKMNSNKYIQCDEKLLPISMNDVTSKYDFNDYKSLRENYKIDNFFLLNKKDIHLQSSKYELVINSDFEGTQIYTDAYFDGVKTTLSNNGKLRGVAIEPQDNQLNRKELLPNQLYERYIELRFKKL